MACRGNPGIVFLSGEALFLRGGDDDSIAHQTGGAVVIEGGDAENVHGWSSRMKYHLEVRGSIQGLIQRQHNSSEIRRQRFLRAAWVYEKD